ncbi:hypothetical protein [Streptomyces sp. KR55]|uniref:hypothetical protein n=1 Tax=Streptomyces sp. KR55 TaxID=3457425 RepID=UPI003FD68D71
MEVISTDGRRNWSVRDVTEALGEPLKAIRRNRSVLESLHDRGVLAKEEVPGGRGTTKKKVFYRLRAPWQAA